MPLWLKWSARVPKTGISVYFSANAVLARLDDERDQSDLAGGTLCSPLLACYPLATGFPPIAVSLPNLWRFAPGLVHLPSVQWRRWSMYRRGPAGYEKRSAASVQDLFASGADYLEFPTMMLRFCLDRGEYQKFHSVARERGNVSQALVGRLIALEAAYRGASANGIL
jgi:hypothetical protein